MTPESIRVLSKLRSDFYSLFVSTMNVPVKISGSSYNSVSFIASWIDDRDQLNYLNIYAYTAPDELLLERRPFILRVAINKGIGSVVFARQGQLCRGLNQRWQFELTVLPEEIMDFLPWVVSLIKAKAKGSSAFAQEPPHPLTSDVADIFVSEKVWTRDAEKVAELQHAIS